MTSLERHIIQYLDNLEQDHQLRSLPQFDPHSKVIYFNDNDYYNLSNHPEVIKSAIKASQTYATGTRSSRLVSTNNYFYEELEQTLARVKNTQTSIVFGSGYLTNIGVIPALAQNKDLIIADKLVHASIIDGAKLSQADFYRFKHNNLSSCEELLQKYRNNYNQCFLITETVFSMDGDIAPIEELLNLCQKYDAYLISDDAHGLGIIKNLPTNPRHIQIGTLSKAIGCYGGYVATTKLIASYIINRARSLIYSTALPISILAAANTALQILDNDPILQNKPLENSQYFTKLTNLPKACSQIVPYFLNDNEKALNLSKNLLNHGFHVSAIRPPTVPKNTARLRISFKSLHSKDDIESLANILNKLTAN